MKKGDKVQFTHYHKREEMNLIGIYLGFNGVAHIVLRENVYYWVKP
jgi:hypothetical protein